MVAILRPQAAISPTELANGQRHLVQDLAWASVTGAFAGGVILIAFALALGATPLHVGLLAAIPFMTQAAQLPATLLVERVRRRRAIGVLTLTAARVLVTLMALLPFLPSLPMALWLLLAV